MNITRFVTGMLTFATFAACACAPTLKGRWDGSGELGEARFFDFTIDLTSKQPQAVFSKEGASPVSTLLCNVEELDGHVEFSMDPDGSVTDCGAMKNPLTFVGDFGKNVLTGKVLERTDSGTEKLVGLFRAFRFVE